MPSIGLSEAELDKDPVKGKETGTEETAEGEAVFDE